MRILATLFLLFALALPLAAQTPGACAHGTAAADLDASDVRATLYNNGNLFYGGGAAALYLVPKATDASALYAANLWVGGTVDGELRTAAATFQDFEFWPGPLEAGATLPDPDDCSAYDRIWVVSAADLAAYDDTGVATNDLAEWPAELGAEVIDGDGIAGNYDLAAGDRPRLYGSQTAFWVMNDVGNVRKGTGSTPIGLEVQVTAFAVSSAEAALDQATFYRVKVINRNMLALEDARFSVFADTDMGAGSPDELEGVDVPRGLGFYYNEEETDAVYGVPPAAGFDFLDGGLGSFTYAINSGPAETGDPFTLEGYINMQRGRWRDGTPLTASGNGYETDGEVTVWAFPDDPVTAECWSGTNDCNGGTQIGGNHRIIPSSPDFTLQPGESKVFDVAYLFAQGADHLGSVTELRAASDLVQAAYDGGTLFDAVPVANEDSGTVPSALRIESVHPNPARSQATITYALERAGPVRLSVHDVRGREVAVLRQERLPEGTHRVAFDGSGLASGMYFVVLEADSERQTRKLLVVR